MISTTTKKEIKLSKLVSTKLLEMLRTNKIELALSRDFPDDVFEHFEITRTLLKASIATMLYASTPGRVTMSLLKNLDNFKKKPVSSDKEILVMVTCCCILEDLLYTTKVKATMYTLYH